MKIGVLSDTHIPIRADELPQIIYNHFKDVDLILHAGDLVELKVLDILKGIKPDVKAVFGNMDPPEVRRILPAKQIIEIKNFKIGLIHGFGPPKELIKTIKKEFGKIDAIVYGHSHFPVNENEGGVLFFNPGSPTDKIFAPYNSFGILNVDDKITGEIIRV